MRRAAPSRGPIQGNGGRYQGTFTLATLDLQLSTKHVYPLSHPRKTDPLSGSTAQCFERGGIEPVSKVMDRQVDLPVASDQLDADPLRIGMLAYVGQRFLEDPEEGDLHLLRQALLAEAFVVVDVVALVLEPLYLEGDCGRKAQVV